MSVIQKDLGAATAYGYAVEKGYTGTEAEFAELMADYAAVGQRAEDAAESALNSKTAAQTAATTATNKASEATTAATTATNKASEAQTSAQTASSKASEASQSASQASGYAQTAETAKTDAQTAKTQADTARDEAVTAKTAAETAQGKAEDAQAAAESVAESIPSDYSQLSEDVSDLKEDLTQDNVPAVKRDMTYHAQVNYLDPNRLINGYVTKNGNVSTASTRCRTDYIPVSEGDVLRSYRREYDETTLLTNDAFRNMSYIAAYDSAKQVIPSEGNDNGVNSYTVPEGVAFVILSFYNRMKDNLGMLTFNEEATEFVPYGDRYTANPAILDGAFSDKTAQPYPSIGHVTVTGELGAGESLEIASTSCRKNMRYTFSCKITSFTGVKIGNSISQNNGSWIEIDDTNIVVKYRESNTDVTVSTTPHGLTIADFLYIEIITGDDAKANITLLTNGGSFDLSNQKWGGYGVNAYAVTSVSSVLADCVFVVGSSDFRKKIWLVGDSYINSMLDNRWPYYLRQNGFINNLLLMGYPGLAPREGWPLFKTALGSFGRPYYAIWALGMNGGGDANDTIEALYWANLRYFLSRCKVFNVTPVLCTIPSVPTLNHEARNTWIRSSGYRYIDFADAVGAQADGTWYNGMLSNDNVHPSTLGAKALYMRAIRDFPELTFDEQG